MAPMLTAETRLSAQLQAQLGDAATQHEQLALQPAHALMSSHPQLPEPQPPHLPLLTPLLRVLHLQLLVRLQRRAFQRMSWPLLLIAHGAPPARVSIALIQAQHGDVALPLVALSPLRGAAQASQLPLEREPLLPPWPSWSQHPLL